MSYYDRALELKDELIENRRYLHSHAEAGLTLPNTVAYVEKKLREYGIEPERCGEGVTALIGKGGKVLLLRADMDALEMPEESGLAFASMNPQTAHCCGHDMHAAMLLTAAKMLKEHESELQGTVKLMFQPGEECLNGSLNMLENGILENPKVDAALAYHVGPGKLPIGMFMYNDNSTMMYSNNEFSVTVKGKGGHGAMPQNCIDPISVGAHIIIALQEIIARELDPHGSCVITVGTFHAGTAMNIIPETARLTGTLRADTKEAQTKLVQRVREVTQATAAVYGATADIEISAGGDLRSRHDRRLREVYERAGSARRDGIPKHFRERVGGLCFRDREGAIRLYVSVQRLYGRARKLFRAQSEGAVQRGSPSERRCLSGPVRTALA